MGERRVPATPSAPSDAASKGSRPKKKTPARHVLNWLAVAILLATFWGLATSSVTEKCNTFDKMAHLTSGYTYLALGDYRLNPSNLCLSQKLAALPLLWSEVSFPSLDQPAWREMPHFLSMGYQFFFQSGNDIQSLLWRARAMVALAGCVLGLVIYLWARRLFGPAGGLISLATFTFCPPCWPTVAWSRPI